MESNWTTLRPYHDVSYIKIQQYKCTDPGLILCLQYIVYYTCQNCSTTESSAKAGLVERFSINFMSRSDFESDVIFHMINQYDKNQIAFNAKNSGGSWENEEVYNDTGAYVAGKQFTVLIALKDDKFMTTVNGNHIADFKVRKSTSYIKYLHIAVDINISSVEFESFT
ncbi:hypothetical protein Trydic_g921 [Trypoxylus dichotomus]